MKKLRRKNINNSNKLIIGVSILFCAIILIVGATTAYFSQGVGANTDDIVSTDLSNTLKYTDNNDYMRGNLIPVVEEDVTSFAMQNSAMNNYGQEEDGNVVDGNNVNGNNVSDYYYIDDDICRYNDEYNACSLYEFTIKNTSEVVQKINATLTPNPNTFKNLYYMIYEEEQEKLTPSSKIIKTSTHINETDTSNMFEEVVLNPDEEKTYTLLFYIKSMDYDQTAEDAGKNFGAIVSVNSLTTGYNIMKTYGDACYDVEKINGGKNDGLFKITKFKGISEETGQPIPGCGVTVSEDNEEYYTVVVPSEIGGYDIDILGNNSFTALGIAEIDGEFVEILNNRVTKINNVIISEGIKKIEDANEDIGFGAFSFLGFEDFESEPHEIKIKFPTSLEYIGTHSFYYSVLQAVTIPKNVEKIGESAFSVFSEEINLSFEGVLDGTSKLRIIEDYAFSTLSNSSLIIPVSVEYIGEDAFDGNENLTTLIFMGTQDGTSKLKTIGDSAFRDSAITKLEIPSGVETIGDYAFSGTSISSLTIPKTVTTIGGRAFSDNENLTTLTFEEGSQLKTIEGSVFSGTSISSLTIPKTVTTIEYGAFQNNSNLTTLTFEEGSQLETIGGSAFNGTSISSLTIPKTVTSIGNKAFSSCENLTTLTFEEGSQLKTIGDSAFSNTGLESITIPSKVTSIGDSAFSNNINLLNIIFENDSQLEKIGSYTFSNTRISSITFGKNSRLKTIERSAFSDNSSLTSVIFGSGSQLQTIGEYAFSNTGLESITIPSKVTSIEWRAFRDNSSLTSVTFESDSELQEIGGEAFFNTGLTSITIPSKVTSIGVSAFEDNSSLTSLTFESGSELQEIGGQAFYNCNLIYPSRYEPLMLPSSITSIGVNAFDKNGNLVVIYFPGSLSTLTSWSGKATVLKELPN